MAKMLHHGTVLLTRDVVAAANYYRDQLGFSYNRFWGEPPCFVILHREGCCVMLRQTDNPDHVVPNWKRQDQLWNLYIWVDDVDAVYAEMKQRGAVIDYELGLKPYGNKEFGVQDLDGHDIAIGQEVDDD